MTGPSPTQLSAVTWVGEGIVLVGDGSYRGSFVVELDKPTATLVIEVPPAKGKMALGGGAERLWYVSALPTGDEAALVEIELPRGITGEMAGPVMRGRTLLATPLGLVKPQGGPGIFPPGGPGPFPPGGPPGRMR